MHHVTFFVGAFWFRLCCVDDGTLTCRTWQEPTCGDALRIKTRGVLYCVLNNKLTPHFEKRTDHNKNSPLSFLHSRPNQCQSERELHSLHCAQAVMLSRAASAGG